MENTLLSGNNGITNSSTKGILAKPNNNKRQTWVSLVGNVVKNVENTDIDLTRSLVRIREAEEIPVKWNRINKPKFMIFLSSINGYQVNPKIDEQSWDLISKALKEERENKGKNSTKTDRKKYTANNKIIFGEDENMETENVTNGNLKLKREAEDSGSQIKGSSFEERKMARKLAQKSAKHNSAKQKLINNAEWTIMVQSLIKEVGNENEDLISHLQRISHAPNIPHKVKWSVMNRPNFMTFLMNIPAYKVDPTLTDRLWNLIMKCLNEHRTKTNKAKADKPKEPPKSGSPSEKVKTGSKELERKQNWMTICQNIMLNNEDKKIKNSLQTMCEAPRIPRHLNKLNRDKFMTFLQNVPSFQVNPAVDEKIWSLLCKALEDQMKNTVPEVDVVKQEDVVVEKRSKRKSALTHDNLSSSKKTKKESREFPIEDHSENSGIALSPLGKNLLQDHDDNELPVKKSKKKKSVKDI